MLNIMVDVNAKEATDYLRGIFGNMDFFLGRIGWMVAQKNAAHIRRTNFKKSSPNGMLSSIEAKKISDKVYGVFGFSKWRYIETGRPPGKRPPAGAGGRIQRWAGGNKLAGYKLSRAIGARGTRPTWFVRRGVASARPDWIQSVDSHTDYYIKSGGKML